MAVVGEVVRRAGGRRIQPLVRELPAASTAAVVASTSGYLLAAGRTALACAIVMLPVAALLMVRFRLIVTLLAISLPFPLSIVGGGALNIAISDVLLALLLVVVAVEWLAGRLPQLAGAAKPVMVALSPYLAWLVVLLAAHFGTGNLIKTVQRLELVLVPVLVGVIIGLRREHLGVMRAYVATATVFAALYPFFSGGNGGLGVQKNPAGQFIANAFILLLALRQVRTRWLIPAFPALAIGLLWTQSRGAFVSVVVALIVLVIGQSGKERARSLALLVPLTGCVIAAFSLLPEDAQTRNLDYSTTSHTDAAQSAEARQHYADEAWKIIDENPWMGVGVGNYIGGTADMKPSSVDPHNVLLLQGAEGGYPLIGAFLVMILGTVAAVLRDRRVTGVAAAAAAVLLASVGHGLVDVYWVRGTPVLGWLLVGMAAGLTRVPGENLPERDRPRAGEDSRRP